jgi:single-strand DNA-binding protein
MNSCILMATIIRTPELRYTQENQTPVTQMLVEFDNVRPDAPPSTLKVVGWGNLATEIQQTYSEGDRVIIEGRLSMNVVERPDGLKEKRAELVVSRIHPLNEGENNRLSLIQPHLIKSRIMLFQWIPINPKLRLKQRCNLM